MKYKIAYSKHYKNAVKKLNKEDLSLVENLLNRLANDETLEPKYKDHKLKGSLKGLRECHILKAINVGSHSEVF